MADYIERETVLNALSVFNDRIHGNEHFLNGIETAKEIVEKTLTADVVPMEWIPVTERLPNENGEYLVSGKDKVWVCEFMKLGDVGGWCNSVRNPCVKYWIPLPKPPLLN